MFSFLILTIPKAVSLRLWGIFFSSVLALNSMAVWAWDTGPEKCKHNECSGGETTISGQKWDGNTHLWVVNRALELLAKSNDATAKLVSARMNNASCRAQWESGLWEVDHGYLAEDIGIGQSNATAQRLGSHFYNPTGLDAFGKPTDITTYSLLGERRRFGDARLNARYRLPGMLRRPSDGLPDTNLTINAIDLRIPANGSKPLSDRDLLSLVFKPYYPGSYTDDTEHGNERCYDLGLALHYLTDIAEPMHASSFDAFKDPYMLHAVFEEYVPTIQAKFPVTTAMTWKNEATMVKSPKSADQVFDEVARASNSMAPALLNTLLREPGGCRYSTAPPIIDYNRRKKSTGCFRATSQEKAMEAMVGSILEANYQWVATYLWAAFNDEYQATVEGKRCPIGTQWGNDSMCYQACPIGFKPTEPITTFCIEACPADVCVNTNGEKRNPQAQRRNSTHAQIPSIN